MHYYNEFDHGKAVWLRELIRQNVIPEGVVDERPIQQVQPEELGQFTQCHFFAGIGVWAYALRQANWPQDRQVWTGSCPCQPFSCAGRQATFADDRHLWPEFYRLIQVCRPDTVFGEQVAGRNGLAWLNNVQVDLENNDYAIGAAITPACGYGAPHRRERLYFVAHSTNQRHERSGRARGRRNGSANGGPTGPAMGDTGLPRLEGRQSLGRNDGPQQPTTERAGCATDAMEHAERAERWPHAERSGCDREGQDGQGQAAGGAGERSETDSMGDSTGSRSLPRTHDGIRGSEESRGSRDAESERRGPVNGYWADAEWIYCRDEKYRAAKPGTFPLAHGTPNRVLQLRGYGDAIVAPQAQAFIEAYLHITK